MDFSPCLSKKRQSHGLGVRLRWAFPPACRGKGCLMDLVCACDELLLLPHLPVEEKAISWTSRMLAMGFSRFSPSACRGKGLLMDLVRACDGLSPLPVEEKAVLWTWCALAMGFPLCLSRKRLSRGLGARLRWAFPPASRGKGYLMDLAVSYSPCLSRKRPSHGLGARLRWSFRPACRGKGLLMGLVRACDGLLPLPVEEKAVSWPPKSLRRAKGYSHSCFPPCLSSKRSFHGLGAHLQWAFPPCLSMKRQFICWGFRRGP